MSDYGAIVSYIAVKPFPGMDRIQLGNVLGYQVVVGNYVKTGDVGLLFPPDGQLSEEFCAAHNLVRDVDPETGVNRGGYFSANRRITAQGFRGQKSEAFWVPISYLDFTGRPGSDAPINEVITEWNGVPICNKWINPETLAARQQNANTQRPPRFQSLWFREHFDTGHLRHVSQFPAGALVWLTEKLHGTSHREGVVPVISNGWVARLLARFGYRRVKWENVSGSRRVVLSNKADKFYGTDFRQRATQDWRDKLRQGEVVYGEIVGWASEHKPIMPNHDATKVSKEFAKEHGKVISYDYGLPPGEAKFYAYRIVQHGPDGSAVELPFMQVMARCVELGIDSVPVLDCEVLYEDHSVEYIQELAADAMHGVRFMEGVAIRVEGLDGSTKIYKEKCHEFKVMEGIAQESGIDIEEAS